MQNNPDDLKDLLTKLPAPTAAQPYRILFSACFAGVLCGYDASCNGEYPITRKIMAYDNVKPILFCPETYSFGSPREMCDLTGGDGFDALAGKAKVLSESGVDWTEGMIAGARAMLQYARENEAHFAIMMDVSAACGSQVVYDGNRFGQNIKYQRGAGVSAALLRQNGIPVVSQRDFKTLNVLLQKIDPEFTPDPLAKDHHETDWYKTYFGLKCES